MCLRGLLHTDINHGRFARDDRSPASESDFFPTIKYTHTYVFCPWVLLGNTAFAKNIPRAYRTRLKVYFSKAVFFHVFVRRRPTSRTDRTRERSTAPPTERVELKNHRRI